MATLSRQPAPVFGREREQARLRELLDLAIADQGSLVLVSGEAGIGKTTLVNDLARQAEADGVLVLSGGCYDLTTTPPYGPWIELCSNLPDDVGLTRVLEELSDEGDFTRVGSQASLFNRILQNIASIAADQPLLLILEDLHWSDQASLELLRFVARRIQEFPVLLIATYRDDEHPTNPQFSALLPLLVRESDAHRIHLNRLDRAAFEVLIAHHYPLEAADAMRLHNYLWRLSAGNPLFAGELLRELEESGVLHQAGSRWQAGELDETPVPALLQQVIEARLSNVQPETRSALQTAAVIGQEVSPDLWQSLARLDNAALDAVAGEALAAAILEETPGKPGFRFRHALFREVLYTSLIVSQRQRRHLQVAEALTTRPNADPDTVAHHFVQASDPRAVHWLIRAGMRAEERYALWMAAERYQRALELMETGTDSTQEQGWLRLHIAYLFIWKELDETLPHLNAARQLARLADDPVLAACSLHLRGQAKAMRGDIRTGSAEIRAAADEYEQVSPPDEERARRSIKALFPDDLTGALRRASGSPIYGIGELPGVYPFRQHMIQLLGNVGYYTEAIEQAERHLASVAAVTDDAVTTCIFCRFAYHGLARSSEVLGRPEEARRWWRTAIEAGELISEHVILGIRLSELLRHVLDYQTERVTERRTLAQAAEKALQAANQDGRLPVLVEFHDLWLDLIEGRWDNARRLALLLPDKVGHIDDEMKLRTFGLLGREQADPELIELALAVAARRLPEELATQPGDVTFDLAIRAQQLRVAIALDTGDLEQAGDWLTMHDEWLEWSGATFWRPAGELLWSRRHRLAKDHTAARRHAERALVFASNPRQPLALIAAWRALGELATEAGQFTEAAEHLDQSLQLATACAAPFEIALTRAARAELALASGDTEQATNLLTQARETGEHLSAQRLLSRIDAIETQLASRSTPGPAGLTPRELDVLRLVARGMSNNEAGEELYISPRTVSQHLSSIYSKLGVSNRAEATRFAVENGLT